MVFGWDGGERERERVLSEGEGVLLSVEGNEVNRYVLRTMVWGVEVNGYVRDYKHSVNDVRDD